MRTTVSPGPFFSNVSWSCVGACTGSWKVWESVSLYCFVRVVHLKQTGHQHDSFIAQLFMVWSVSSHLESSTLYSRQRGPVPLRKRPLAGRGVDRLVPTSVTVVVQLAARCNTSLPVTCLAVQGPSASCLFFHVRVSVSVSDLLRAVD